MKRVKNEDLPTVKPDFAGNKVDDRGRFCDEYSPYLPSLMSVVKWKLSTDPLKDLRRTTRGG